jgi:HemY protein
VLLTAQAQSIEDEHADKAAALAIEAHTLAPELVPAAAIAGRVLASRGQTPKAARVLQKTWKLNPHPDLATAYAFARPGDSVNDRLERVRQLAKLTPGEPEGALAVAATAVEGRNWEAARDAIAPLVDKPLTQRVCTLMARIEGDGFQNAGKVREWLARAVHAERDPAWTADGVVADRWAPVSPVTGRLDAFEWKVPAEAVDKPDRNLISQRMDDLLKLGVGPANDARPAAPERVPLQREEASTIEIVEDGEPTGPKRSATVTPLNSPPRGKSLDANAFITPRAPDDPGPDKERAAAKL